MCGNNQDLTNDDDVDIQIPSMVEITIQSDKHSTSVFAQKLSSGLEQINVFSSQSVLQDFQHSDEVVLMDHQNSFTFGQTQST